MKKLLALVLILVMVSCCALSEEVVNLYNWYDYMDETVFDDFYAETGIKVNCMYFTQNEDMMIQLRVSPGAYDLVIPSDYCVERMIKEGLIQEINFDNVPNYSYIMDSLKGADYDPDSKYTVPFMWGTVGILYDTTKVSAEEVTTWAVLWDEKYKDDIIMMDSLRDGMMVGAKYLGYSLNTSDPLELKSIKDALIVQKRLAKAYYVDETKDKMVKGDAALALIYSGDALYAMEKNENLAYSIPAEGSNIWVDPLVIPASAKNKENAEKLINFLCRPDIAQRNCEYIYYSSPNTGAIELMGEEYTSNTTINPSEELTANCEFYHDLDEKTLTLYTNFWEQVKNAN